MSLHRCNTQFLLLVVPDKVIHVILVVYKTIMECTSFFSLSTLSATFLRFFVYHFHFQLYIFFCSTVTLSLVYSFFFAIGWVIEKFWCTTSMDAIPWIHLFVNHPSNHLCWLPTTTWRNIRNRKETRFCCTVSVSTPMTTMTKQKFEQNKSDEKKNMENTHWELLFERMTESARLSWN